MNLIWSKVLIIGIEKNGLVHKVFSRDMLGIIHWLHMLLSLHCENVKNVIFHSVKQANEWEVMFSTYGAKIWNQN